MDDIVAIIPARKGSKRVPNKNMRLFCGKPLIEYSIISAVESTQINRIVITTNIEEVGLIVDKYKDKKQIDIDWRPENLCEDDCSAQSYVNHLKDKNMCGDINVLLQPTSPIRDTNFLDNCIKFYILNEIDCFLTVKEIARWVYYPNGIVYIFKDTIYKENMYTLLMDMKDSIDINTEEEFIAAERIYNENLIHSS